MRTSALSSINIRALTRNNKDLLVNKPVASRPDKYVGLDLT